VRCSAGPPANTITIARAQEGTSAIAHNTGGKTYKMILGLTKKMIDDIDSTYLNVAGDTVTGTINFADQILQRPVLKDYGESLVVVDSPGETYTIDMINGNTFKVSMNTSITYTISNPPGNTVAGSFTLEQIMDSVASRTVSFTNTIVSASGSLPTVTPDTLSTDLYTFYTSTNGRSWTMMAGAQNIS
jgi:hypothetical protein